MPRFDGTGPEGKGPMTGMKMGPCAKSSKTKLTGRGFGRRRAGK